MRRDAKGTENTLLHCRNLPPGWRQDHRSSKTPRYRWATPPVSSAPTRLLSVCPLRVANCCQAATCRRLARRCRL